MTDTHTRTEKDPLGSLEVPADATAAMTGYMIHANALGKASFTAKYGRAK